MLKALVEKGKNSVQLLVLENVLHIFIYIFTHKNIQCLDLFLIISTEGILFLQSKSNNIP